MTNGSIDEWVGKHVGVHFVAGSAVKGSMGSCILEGADERGIVVSYHGEALSQTYWFYPWHKIEWVRLLRE